MKLRWIILGTLIQLNLAYFLFMLVAFSGGGLANGGGLSEARLQMIDFFLYALPISCLVCSVWVIVQFKNNGTAKNYLWYCTPLLLTTVYLFVFF